MKKDTAPKPNTHPNRESWLAAATHELRPYFSQHGCTLPDNIRFAIAFTSGGKRGMQGECWHAQLSNDKHFEIIIKADKDDPLEVLGILTHELVHTLLPLSVKHGKEFREIALKIGLEGKMSHPELTPRLQTQLETIAKALGYLPHATFNFLGNAEKRKKSGARYLKAECDADGCGYTMRVIPKWAKVGLPTCPANSKHGLLRCDIPDDDNAPDHGDIQNNGGEILPQQKSSRTENRYTKLQQQDSA